MNLSGLWKSRLYMRKAMKLYVRFVLQMFSPAGFQRERPSDESLIDGHKALDIMLISFL